MDRSLHVCYLCSLLTFQSKLILVFSRSSEFRNQPEVRKALGVSSERTFESCNMQVNQAFQFQGDVSHNTAALIPPLLEDGIRVLIYAGDADFMVRCSAYYVLCESVRLIKVL